MKLKATTGHVVIKRDQAQAQSKGGILIPDQAKGKPLYGVLVSIGAGAGLQQEADYLRNQRVAFRPYAGHEIEEDGESFVIVEHKDVLAILEG